MSNSLQQNQQLQSKKKKRRRKEDEEMYLFRNAPLQKPSNQEKLQNEELKEEFSRTLTIFDPLKRKNMVIWDFSESTYVSHVDETSYITLFSMPSELVDPNTTEDLEELGELINEFPENDEIGKKADESKVKDALVNVKLEDPSKIPSSELVDNSSSKTSLSSNKDETSKEPETKDEEAEEIEEEKEEQGSSQDQQSKKLLNQFNFCERAAQTTILRFREHEVQTDNPERSHYRGACNQWLIYDAYSIDAINRPISEKRRHSREEGIEENESEGKNEDAREKKEGANENEHGGESSFPTNKEHKKEEMKLIEKPQVKMRKASNLMDGYQTGGGDAAILLKAVDGLRFIERLVGSNVFEDVYEDFKYYEDTADEYRDPTESIYGTLLPLWKFSYDKAKKIHVTSISWSKSEPDIFAVTYGSFNFSHPVRFGYLIVYTLRNPTYPEFIWSTPRGAMSCHIHPQRNSLVAVGLYNGNVGVLNLEKNEENKSKTDILKNIPTVLKHIGPVWTVQWGTDSLDGSPTFYSAGMDGTFIQWIVDLPVSNNVGGLKGTLLATFYLPNEPVPGPDGISYKLFGCARVISFHPKDKTRFLVGTAEGKILRCSVKYASNFQMIYDAHFLPVASLEWNNFHEDIFISCSEDWTIKIWNQYKVTPMYVFEVGLPILDVCWAPYSSTVFGAVNDDGKVLIYDLVVNKERPICTQQIVPKKKTRLHRIQFNPKHPIVIVGDDKGILHTLKLSPNLRIIPKDSRNVFYLEGEARVHYEITKLKKLLTLVEDPDSIRRKSIENVSQDEEGDKD